MVPKYYHPRVENRSDRLDADGRYTPITLGDLEHAGHLEVDNGHDLLKLEYGTGSIPYVRTSDLGSLEIAATPKQGIGDDVYERYASRQSVRPGDIFFVKDGTYLVGKSAIITDADLPLVYQSHMYRFRLTADAPIAPALLLLLLSTRFVQEQVRSKQFAAGIIDKIEDRYREIVLPVPARASDVAWLTERMLAIVQRRTELRERLRLVPLWAQGIIADLDSGTTAERGGIYETAANLGFTRRASDVNRSALIPKYHDPAIAKDLEKLSREYHLKSIQSLVDDRALEVTTGIEVGKMAYGTGDIPFVRTSDLSNWELKSDVKQRVSEEIYNEYKAQSDAAPFDVLLVRDGTYLVGTSAIVTEDDGSLLFAGGVYRLRCDPEKFDPFLLLAALKMPIVARQIRSKQFTRDIIDTLGKRLFEVFLPIPKDSALKTAVADTVRKMVVERSRLRHQAMALAEALMNHPAGESLQSSIVELELQ